MPRLEVADAVSTAPRVYIIGVQGVIAPYVIQGYERAFRQLGCEVRYYDINHNRNMEMEIAREAVEFSPDFVLSYRDIAVMPALDSSGYLFERLGIPAVLLFYDNPFYTLAAERVAHFKRCPEMYQLLVWDTEYIDLLHSEGVAAEHVLLALDESNFAPCAGGASSVYKYDVSFAGSLRETPAYPTVKNETFRNIVATALDERLRDHTKTLREVVGAHFPQLHLGLREYTEVNWHLHGDSEFFRWRLLSALGGEGVHIFGSQTAPVGATLHGRIDYRTELPEVYRQSRINLSINSLQLEHSLNNRLYDVAGVGGFVLAERKPDLFLASPATADEIAYGSPEELKRKVDFFLRHDRERSALAESLHKDILAAHTYRHRAQFILDVMAGRGGGRARTTKTAPSGSLGGQQGGTMDSATATIDPKAKEYTFAVPAVVDMIPAGLQRALDVGCSGGALGHYLKTHLGFAHVSGIEYSAPAAAKARGHLDTVFEGDACLLDLPGEYDGFYDIIIYADVLEHLYDPWSVVRKHKQYLRPGGYMLACIPNLRNLFVIMNLLADRFDYTDVGLLDNTHLRFFTGATAIEMFTKEGLSLVQSRRSIRDAKWHADMNDKATVSQPLLDVYEQLYQKYIQGEDCTADLQRYFGLFQFTNEALADLLTAQFQLLFQLPSKSE